MEFCRERWAWMDTSQFAPDLEHPSCVILKESTPHPLAVRLGSYGDEDALSDAYWKILHPAQWHANNDIQFAARKFVLAYDDWHAKTR